MRRGWRECNPREVEAPLTAAAQRLKHQIKGGEPYPNPNGGGTGTSLAPPMGWVARSEDVPAVAPVLKVHSSLGWPSKKSLSVTGNLDRYAPAAPEALPEAPAAPEPEVCTPVRGVAVNG